MSKDSFEDDANFGHNPFYLVRSTRGAKHVFTTSNDDRAVVEDAIYAYPQQSVDEPKSTESKRSLRNKEIPRIPSVADFMQDERRWAIEHYQNIEAALNSRRKIMYTDTKMMEVFTTMCKCPFEKRHLKPLNYREYIGLSRADFIMLYDYTISFMDFNELEPSQKNVLYRYVCGVDSLMNTAYLTTRLGFEDKRIVLSSCEYICIDPMPMSGDEPWAQHLFSSKEDQIKYKSIIPWKAALWSTLVIPFHELDIQFDEFCILKALTCWHISHYKFNENGRRVCGRQRNLLIGCLTDICRQRAEDPSERVGNLILYLSCVFKSTLAAAINLPCRQLPHRQVTAASTLQP
ncbi:Ligand-binding domain of nuclear hormone receptor [Cooperia oncophora]